MSPEEHKALLKDLARPCVLLPLLLSMELLVDVSLDLYEYDLKHSN